MRILIDGQTLSTPDIYRGVGEVLLNILPFMNDLGSNNEFFLAVYDDYDVNSVAPILDSITLVRLGDRLTLDNKASEGYQRCVAEIIDQYSIDIFWIPNALMQNVHMIKVKPSCWVVVTIYDLIPLIFEDYYLKQYPKHITADYVSRISRIDAVSDRIVSISDSTKNDLTTLLQIDSEKIETIYLGSKVPVINTKQKSHNDKKYILYLGGFDYRKNMYNALLAFKKLVDKYYHYDLTFVVVCSYTETSRKEFFNWVDQLGLSGRVELPGYLSDSTLHELYRGASVFFYPSLYEGFGLPVLEAMASGTPVAASDCSSIPEIVGDAGLLFDPQNPDDMAEKLNKMLSDTNFADTISNKAQKRAAEFTWEKAAIEYVNVFERIGNSCNSNSIKPYKIAYFSPVSPQKSGISIYSEELLYALSRYVPDIDLFLDEDVTPSNSFIQEKIRYFPYMQFDELMSEKRYDTIIYNMGNNILHKYIYETLLKHPGIVILHDYVLHPFIQHITALDGRPEAYVEEMRYAYGEEGERHAKQYIEGSYPPLEFFKYPLNERVIEASKKIIVHSSFIKNLLKRFNHIEKIPHGRASFDIQDDIIMQNKYDFKLLNYFPIIGCFGFMNPNKRINVLLDAFIDVVNKLPDAVLILCGDIDKNFRFEIESDVKRHNISDNIIITGFLEDEIYLKYLSCVDIVVNLRSPTMGETSGTLLDALAFGRPTIVSNIGSYKEVPDKCCWKVDVDGYERDLLSAYILELVHNDRLREKMGSNAKEYIERYHKWDRIAQKYVNVIERVINA